MKYAVSKTIVFKDELGKLKGEEYLVFLKFALKNSDMISLCVCQMSLEKAVTVVEKYAPSLVSEIIDSEITDTTHCTTYRGGDVPVFYFKTGQAVKEFLEGKLCLFDFVCTGRDWLDDLAFYKNGVCRISTCTHEGYVFIDEQWLKAYQKTKSTL
jgi:hypothetical protein